MRYIFLLLILAFIKRLKKSIIVDSDIRLRNVSLKFRIKIILYKQDIILYNFYINILDYSYNSLSIFSRLTIT